MSFIMEGEPAVLRELRAYADELFDVHGLDGWTFNFDNATRRFGVCKWRKRTITLSRELSLMHPVEARETLRHEVAHAITDPDAPPHGYEWYESCKLVGAKPERCHSAQVPPGRYRGSCPEAACTVTYERERLTKRARNGVCRYHYKQLKWELNPDWLEHYGS